MELNMASKKKKKTRAKTSTKSTAARPVLNSKFANDFEKEILRGTNRMYKWPKIPGGPPVSDNDTYQGIGDTVMVLGLAAGGPVPSKTGAAFRDQVIDFVNTHPWPQGAGLPAPYRKPAMVGAVRLSIISDIVHRMLVAVNEGGGGPGDPLPPHRL
jgi:hypothetical protein